MARVATPGEPLMKKVSLELPAEMATITPARAALSAATELELTAEPKFDPRDMLMTSRWSERSPSSLGSIAQSMASATRPVLPAQPNTRRAYSSAFGALPGVPPKPAAVRGTWLPWRLQSIGLASGTGALAPWYASPAKSVPPTTLAVGKEPAVVKLAVAVDSA